MMLSILMRASLDGAILVAIVWTLSRVLPRLSAATRTILWWCAAMKFVVALVWVVPVFVPILPAEDGALANATTTTIDLPVAPAVGDAMNPAVRPRAYPGWSVALVSAWAAGFLMAAGVGLRRWRHMLGVVRRSVPAPAAIHVMAADLADRLGLRRVPEVRVSEDVETPLVTGLRRPIVLLPADRFGGLSDRQQQMALCHELAHVKRADLRLGCAPALAECLFFFHPLVHVAAREYALWREAACDAAVLDALDAAPQEYGRLLLDLGVSRRRTGLAAAGASWSFANLKRRIVMLRDPASRSMGSRLVAATAVGLSVMALVPLQLSARRSPTEPIAPHALAQREPFGEQKKEEGELNYVMFVNDDETTMSGSMSDIKRASRFKRAGEPLLWFRRAGREYVVRDLAVLRQVAEIWKPIHEIGQIQGMIGAQQGAIGSKQAEIGAKQAIVGAQQAMIGAQQAVIGAQQAALAAQRAVEKEHRELEIRMRELDRDIAQLEVKMREFEKPMRDHRVEMEALGKRMEALGQKMEEASRQAEAKMRELLDRAIASGAAEAVK